MMVVCKGGLASVRPQGQGLPEQGIKGKKKKAQRWEILRTLYRVWPGTYLDASTVVRHAGGQGDEN